eukprot:GHVP01033088.1.p1 GENE.GHVP01033088.1~~GHVP01033088.1.p1  ORF type:complete len:627 (-),score=128.81 GHVP01033088.1:62-1942(-)
MSISCTSYKAVQPILKKTLSKAAVAKAKPKASPIPKRKPQPHHRYSRYLYDPDYEDEDTSESWTDAFASYAQSVVDFVSYKEIIGSAAIIGCIAAASYYYWRDADWKQNEAKPLVLDLKDPTTKDNLDTIAEHVYKYVKEDAREYEKTDQDLKENVEELITSLQEKEGKVDDLFDEWTMSLKKRMDEQAEQVQKVQEVQKVQKVQEAQEAQEALKVQKAQQSQNGQPARQNSSGQQNYNTPNNQVEIGQAIKAQAEHDRAYFKAISEDDPLLKRGNTVFFVEVSKSKNDDDVESKGKNCYQEALTNPAFLSFCKKSNGKYYGTLAAIVKSDLLALSKNVGYLKEQFQKHKNKTIIFFPLNLRTQCHFLSLQKSLQLGQLRNQSYIVDAAILKPQQQSALKGQSTEPTDSNDQSAHIYPLTAQSTELPLSKADLEKLAKELKNSKRNQPSLFVSPKQVNPEFPEKDSWIGAIEKHTAPSDESDQVKYGLQKCFEIPAERLRIYKDEKVVCEHFKLFTGSGKPNLQYSHRPTGQKEFVFSLWLEEMPLSDFLYWIGKPKAVLERKDEANVPVSRHIVVVEAQEDYYPGKDFWHYLVRLLKARGFKDENGLIPRPEIYFVHPSHQNLEK